MFMKLELDLFGGRIDCVKFALRKTIDMFEKNNQHDMSLIYRDMLDEIISKEKIMKETAEKEKCKYECKWNNCKKCQEIYEKNTRGR